MSGQRCASEVSAAPSAGAGTGGGNAQADGLCKYEQARPAADFSIAAAAAEGIAGSTAAGPAFAKRVAAAR